MRAEIWAYVKAVFKHGRWLVFAGVNVIGYAATIHGTFNVPRPVWYALIAFGVLGAQFKAWQDVRAELATAKGKLRDLDTVEAKRAYLDEQTDRALGLRGEFEEIPAPAPVPTTSEDLSDGGGVFWMYQWIDTEGVGTLIQDLVHWENGVRAELKEWFSNDTARLFDSDRDLEPKGQGDGRVDVSKANCLAYLDRRLIRLREIRDGL
jgi:hypothetical protein